MNPEKEHTMNKEINREDSRIILIVDDDSRNVFAMGMTLKAHGYSFFSCPNAAEGLKALAEDKRISLVLMDMMMPEMDGYEALRAIRSSPQYPDVPVIAVTAQAMKGDREKCLEAGASGYVKKPVDVDNLLKIIKDLMK